MDKRSATNKTVLVISNGPEQFALTTSLLQDEGYNVHFKNDLRQSLAFVKTRPPDLIISELAVPNVDGLELCYRLRHEKDLGSMPIVLVGDISKQSSIVADGLRCGAADYLQKPVDQVELFDLCRSVAADDQCDPDDDLFKSLIENISDVITIIDADERTILFESPSANRIFGYECGELLGKSMSDLVHPADLKEVVEYFNSVHWFTGSSQPIEYRFRQKDGSWKLIESTARPINDPRFGTAVVVTSREKMREELSLAGALDNQMLRRTMFEDAAIGMAVISLSGHVIETNKSLLEMLDHSADELQDMSLAELIFSSDAENDKRAIANVICGKSPNHQFENGYLLPNGDRLWGQLNIVAIPDCNGEPQFLMAVFEDPSDKPALDGQISDKKTTTVEVTTWKIDDRLISKN